MAELVAAHLTQVPFENISKLYYMKRLALYTIPDINIYLDGIERNHFGGTCYSNNFMNTLLLACFFLDRSIIIHNLTVIESQGTKTNKYSLKDCDELEQAVEELFGISQTKMKIVMN